MLCEKSGITMSETRLFPSEQCDGYFGTKRFDRRIDQTGKKNSYVNCCNSFGIGLRAAKS